MLIAQNYKCAICKIDKCKTNRNFAVDHDHSSNKVRGLLCSNCNVGLGVFKDSEKNLKEAISYLKRYM